MHINRLIKFIFINLLLLIIPLYVSASEKILWSSGSDYIAIVPIEKGAEKNQHPLDISIKDIFALLKSLRISKNNGIFDIDLFDYLSKDEEDLNIQSTSLFNEKELSTLSVHLVKAFSKVSEDEDIVFSITGQHEDFIGKSSQTTAVRLFYRDQFHIILGDTRVDLEQKYRKRSGGYDRTPAASDLKIKHFRLETGSRFKEKKLPFNLLTDENHVLKRKNNKGRNDWMLVNLSELRKEMVKIREIQNKKEKLVEETGSLKDKTNTIEEEQARLKEKIQRLEETLQEREEMSNAENEVRPVKQNNSLEERLAELKGLYEKGLISEETYKSKQKQLLENL